MSEAAILSLLSLTLGVLFWVVGEAGMKPGKEIAAKDRSGELSTNSGSAGQGVVAAEPESFQVHDLNLSDLVGRNPHLSVGQDGVLSVRGVDNALTFGCLYFSTLTTATTNA